MRPIILLITLFCCALTTYAQDDLIPDNINYVKGNTYVFDLADTTGIFPGEMGLNKVWNYKHLKMTGHQLIKTVDPNVNGLATVDLTMSDAVDTGKRNKKVCIDDLYSELNSVYVLYPTVPGDISITDPLNPQPGSGMTFMHYALYGHYNFDTKFTVPTVLEYEIENQGCGRLLMPFGTYQAVLVESSNLFEYRAADCDGEMQDEVFLRRSFDYLIEGYGQPVLSIDYLHIYNNGELTHGRKSVRFSDPGPVGRMDVTENGSSIMALYPNPTSDVSYLSYMVEEDVAQVQVKLYDAKGSEIKNLFTGEQPEGHYRLPVQTNDYKDGLYIVTLNVNGRSTNMRLVVQ